MKTLLTCAPLVLLPALALSGVAQEPDEGVDVPAVYRAVYEAKDRDAMGALWLQHEMKILGTFDADLEGGLKAWEEAGEGHEAKTQELFARALWGAEVASEVTGRPIFSDYASSFTSWNAEQRKSFRAGQKAFGAAMGALRGDEADKAEVALKAGADCRVRATQLGDWWGAAMGYYAEGLALQQLGRHPEASAALGMARLINHDLGLWGSELGAITALVTTLQAMDAGPRALAAAKDGEALATKLGDADRAAAFAKIIASLTDS